jgi:hypothetical protein
MTGTLARPQIGLLAYYGKTTDPLQAKWRRSRKLVFWDARECAPGP